MGKVFIKVQQQYFKPEDKQMYFTKSIKLWRVPFEASSSRWKKWCSTATPSASRNLER